MRAGAGGTPEERLDVPHAWPGRDAHPASAEVAQYGFGAGGATVKV